MMISRADGRDDQIVFIEQEWIEADRLDKGEESDEQEESCGKG